MLGSRIRDAKMFNISITGTVRQANFDQVRNFKLKQKMVTVNF
jgi:hypothetical protein